MNKGNYFQLVAQIVPVLILAVSIQSIYIQKLKFKRGDWFNKGIHVLLFVFFMVILSAGEVAALYAVYSGDFNDGLLQMTIISLLAGLYLVTAQYVVNLKDNDDTATSLTLSYFGGVAVIITSIIVFFVINAL